jgi:hypothetical protein
MQRFVEKLISESSRSNKPRNIGNALDQMQIAVDIKERVLKFIKEAEVLRKKPV